MKNSYVVSAFLFLAVPLSLASGWQIEVVDSAGDVGLYSSLALDSNGNPHIAYFDWDS